MKNALSIDLEEWFTVYNFADHFPQDQWDSLPRRSPKSVELLLDLFDRYNAKATFFVLGWVAEREPDLIREIVRRGHEIASHGYGHELVKEIGQERFRVDLKRSLAAIHAAVDTEVVGYRAPSFSVQPELDWFFSTLHDAGILYDSSLFPVPFHPDYANSSVPLAPYQITEGIREFPMTCVPVAGVNLPCSGGGYFRLFPYFWFSKGIHAVNRTGRPAMFYLHPWEIDPDQPRVESVSRLKKFRHYTNLHRCADRLERLLGEFEFTTVRSVLSL